MSPSSLLGADVDVLNAVDPLTVHTWVSADLTSIASTRRSLLLSSVRSSILMEQSLEKMWRF